MNAPTVFPRTDQLQTRKTHKAAQSMATLPDDLHLLNIGGELIDEHATEYQNEDKERIAAARLERKENSKYGAGGKKPTWWLKRGGSRGSKAQRKARIRLAHYCVPPIHYEDAVNLEELFAPENDNDLEGTTTTTTANKQRELWVELGFGKGLVLRSNAKNNPDRLYLGADVHLPAVGNVLLEMEKHDQEISLTMTSLHVDVPVPVSGNNNNNNSKYQYHSNVRVYAGDGIKMIKALPDSSTKCIALTFPDPMHNADKWRILQHCTLDVFRQKLKAGNGMFLLATDAVQFSEWTVSLFDHYDDNSCNVDGNDRRNDATATGTCTWIKEDPPPREEWLPIVSRYEEKGIAEGRYTICHCWRLAS